MKLTIQKLANLCNHMWELQRELGFHMQNPDEFRRYLTTRTNPELRVIMENLGLLFRAVEDVGASEVELTAAGCPSLFAPLAQTQTSKAAGTKELVATQSDDGWGRDP